MIIVFIKANVKLTMGHTLVRDIMRKSVISIDESMSVKDAATMMDDANVGSIIVTKNNSPAGILTERDFVKRVASKDIPLSTKVSDIMSKPLIVIGPDETVWESAEVMQKNNIHKLPVQENNTIIGIITTTDLVKICSVGSDSNMRDICDQILLRMEKTS